MVTGLRGRPLANVTPATGQVLKWSGTRWTPADDDAGAGSLWSLNGNKAFMNGKLLIRTYNLAGVALDADRDFTFVVYKP